MSNELGMCTRPILARMLLVSTENQLEHGTRHSSTRHSHAIFPATISGHTITLAIVMGT